MVRFIIQNTKYFCLNKIIFTFQYGQIYYKYIKLSEIERPLYLHSNMVRFIMLPSIYSYQLLEGIYIPIWLDLLFRLHCIKRYRDSDLHSNMVRFIIPPSDFKSHILLVFTFQYGQIYYLCLHINNICRLFIYIPIWLDLL